MFQTKRFMSLEKNEWIFLGLSVVNILIAVGLTIERICFFLDDSGDHSMELTFAILLLFNAGRFKGFIEPQLINSSLGPKFPVIGFEDQHFQVPL